jgi:hypothetical protein
MGPCLSRGRVHFLSFFKRHSLRPRQRRRRNPAEQRFLESISFASSWPSRSATIFQFRLLGRRRGPQGFADRVLEHLAQIGQPTLDGLISQCINCCRIELRDHLLRRTLRCPQAGPNSDVESWQSCLIHRGDVRRGRQAHFAGDGVRLDVTIAHMRQGVRRLIEHQIDMPPYQVLHGRGRASVLEAVLDGRRGDGKKQKFSTYDDVS